MNFRQFWNWLRLKCGVSAWTRLLVATELLEVHQHLKKAGCSWRKEDEIVIFFADWFSFSRQWLSGRGNGNPGPRPESIMAPSAGRIRPTGPGRGSLLHLYFINTNHLPPATTVSKLGHTHRLYLIVLSVWSMLDFSSSCSSSFFLSQFSVCFCQNYLYHRR